jgi:uncharacterized membrane protein HdeD (DUF308 family)
MLRAMELILAILGAGAIGFFSPTRRRALTIYLALWVLVFPIQTAVVFSESGSDNNALYWVVNALILSAGIALNKCGALLAERRRAKLDAARAA